MKHKHTLSVVGLLESDDIVAGKAFLDVSEAEAKAKYFQLYPDINPAEIKCKSFPFTDCFWVNYVKTYPSGDDGK